MGLIIMCKPKTDFRFKGFPLFFPKNNNSSKWIIFANKNFT